MSRCAVVAIALLCGLARSAFAAPDPLRIGILEDMSGVYSSTSGKGSAVAAQMAVDDFGGTVLGRPIEVLTGDHQNKADVGSGIAREWFDTQNVAMIAGLGNSSVSIAVHQLARERHRIDIVSTGGSIVLTGQFCSPTGVVWTTDTYAVAKGVASALLAQGKKRWFFVTADYAAGKSMEDTAGATVTAGGGKVLGHALAPVGTSDFSSLLITAQSSGADAIGLANAGGDTVNAIIQTHEFGLTDKAAIAAIYLDASDVLAIGLDRAQGIEFLTPFYWGLDAPTRAWSERFAAKTGRPPSQNHAGAYGAVLHYLQAVKAAGTDDPDAVMRKMRELPIEDFFTHGATLRADGRVMRPMYLVKVRSPAQSSGKLDLLEVLQTVSAEDAFRPPAPAECPLVR